MSDSKTTPFSLSLTLHKLVREENAATNANTDLQRCFVAAVILENRLIRCTHALDQIYANAAEEAELAEAQHEMPFQRMH